MECCEGCSHICDYLTEVKYANSQSQGFDALGIKADMQCMEMT